MPRGFSFVVSVHLCGPGHEANLSDSWTGSGRALPEALGWVERQQVGDWESRTAGVGGPVRRRGPHTAGGGECAGPVRLSDRFVPGAVGRSLSPNCPAQDENHTRLETP